VDRGERAAISLGLFLKDDLNLIDDRKGAAAALNKGFEITGTLGILDLTSFRYRQELLDELLNQQKGGLTK
jgi:predicted nucleic acid-binding protein